MSLFYPNTPPWVTTPECPGFDPRKHNVSTPLWQLDLTNKPLDPSKCTWKELYVMHRIIDVMLFNILPNYNYTTEFLHDWWSYTW